jgi:DNA polymerase-1
LSGDEALCAVYSDPKSKGLHEELRIELYGMPSDWSPGDVDKYQRKWYIREEALPPNVTVKDRIKEEQKMRCKNVNFGIVYGITAFGLAEQIDDTPQEAARMLAGWAAKFPGAWKFIQLCRNAPVFGKNIVTVFGHKKRFQLVSGERLIDMQNEAANFPHQSTASTVTLHAGMRVQKRLKSEFGIDIVNTVHDSIILECPIDRDVIEHGSMLMKREMEKVPVDYGITRIPFQADRKIGMRWGTMGSLEDFYAHHFAS